MSTTSLRKTATPKQAETNLRLLAAAVTGVHFYFDVVWFALKRPLRANELRAINRLGPQRMHVYWVRKGRQSTYLWQAGWRHRYELCQPTDEMLAYLDRLVGSEVHVNRVERAADFITLTAQAATELQRYYRMHLVKPNRGKQRTRAYKGIDYHSQKKWSRNQPVCYSDRPCKITGEPHCLHLEWRTATNRALEDSGIRRFRDLIGTDHVAFWEEHLRLEYLDIDVAALDRAYWGKPHSYRYGRYRCGSLILRAVGYDDDPNYSAPVQDIIDSWPSKLIPKRTLGRFRKPITVSPLRMITVRSDI